MCTGNRCAPLSSVPSPAPTQSIPSAVAERESRKQLMVFWYSLHYPVPPIECPFPRIQPPLPYLPIPGPWIMHLSGFPEMVSLDVNTFPCLLKAVLGFRDLCFPQHALPILPNLPAHNPKFILMCQLPSLWFYCLLHIEGVLKRGTQKEVREDQWKLKTYSRPYMLRSQRSSKFRYHDQTT